MSVNADFAPVHEGIREAWNDNFNWPNDQAYATPDPRSFKSEYSDGNVSPKQNNNQAYAHSGTRSIKSEHSYARVSPKQYATYQTTLQEEKQERRNKVLAALQSSFHQHYAAKLQELETNLCAELAMKNAPHEISNNYFCWRVDERAWNLAQTDSDNWRIEYLGRPYYGPTKDASDPCHVYLEYLQKVHLPNKLASTLDTMQSITDEQIRIGQKQMQQAQTETDKWASERQELNHQHLLEREVWEEERLNLEERLKRTEDENVRISKKLDEIFKLSKDWKKHPHQRCVFDTDSPGMARTRATMRNRAWGASHGGSPAMRQETWSGDGGSWGGCPAHRSPPAWKTEARDANETSNVNADESW